MKNFAAGRLPSPTHPGYTRLLADLYDRVLVYEAIAHPGRTVRLPVPSDCTVSRQILHKGAQWRLVAIVRSAEGQAA